ncbi:MAG: tripartite tricarboxylate transporter substrate binding protein [Burkholderiaceae bacterium]
MTTTKANAFKKIGVSLCAVAGLMAVGSAVAAQDLDCRNVTIISPYPPGGTTDILARILGPGMTAKLGVPVVVDNKPGASSNIGTEFVGRAKPDGCTLLLGNNTGVVINRNLYKLRLDPLKSLQPVAKVASVPLVLYVNPSKIDVKTPQALIDELKAHPDTYSFASGGSGSPQHLAGERIKQQKGVKMLHVPYRGQGPALTDVIAGHVPIAFETTAVLVPHVKSGSVRALATTSAKRLDVLPDVPTMTESGFENFVMENWYGVFAPAGVPAPIVEKLHAAVNAALKEPEAVKALEKMASTDAASSLQEFQAFVKEEAPIWTEIVEKSGARID